MTEQTDTLTIAGEFQLPTYEDWVKEVEKVLKGAPFDKKMLHKTYEGMMVRPVYTRQDWPGDGDPSGFPGAMPFTRGRRASGTSQRGWDICQAHGHPDLAESNRNIHVDLQRGVTSLLLRFDAAARAGKDGHQAGDLAGAGGLMVYSVDDLDRLLREVVLEAAPVALAPGAQGVALSALLAALWRRRGVADGAAVGAFNADPLGTLAATGGLPTPIDEALSQLAELAIHTARTYPNVTAVGIDTSPYHAAGASETQDLAFMLATGVAYLRALTDAGMTVDDAVGQVAVTLPVDCQFFLGIAKLRAARRLWARMAEACGVAEDRRSLTIHAVTADRMMTRCDPWVNMLRTTVAAFAAGVGGADSIAVQPFDAALGLPDELSRRVARNTQVMLMEESSLYRVIDPAGGSWCLETMTDELAAGAWTLFQGIERRGGMAAALTDGSVAEQIDAVYAERVKNLSRRRDPITGVSEFPNIHETVTAHAPPDLAALRDDAARRLGALGGRSDTAAVLTAVGEAKAAKGTGRLAEAAIAAASAGATVGTIADALAGGPTTITALPQRHLAQLYEELRDAGAAHRAKTGRNPLIFLASLGPIAVHTGRATFSKNFFEAGGIEAVTNDGFADAGACAAAFKASGARIAIICSADPVYVEKVPAVAPALKAAGCEYLFLAGAPGEHKDTYKSAGVDDFIFLGGDVLGTLRKTLTLLGVIDQ